MVETRRRREEADEGEAEDGGTAVPPEEEEQEEEPAGNPDQEGVPGQVGVPDQEEGGEEAPEEEGGLPEDYQEEVQTVDDDSSDEDFHSILGGDDAKTILIKTFLKQNKKTKPKKPNMGSIVKQDGHYLLKMGGMPKYDWSDLEEPTATASDLQYRNPDPTRDVKRTANIPTKDPVWTRKDKLSELQAFVMETLQEYGMEQCAYAPHPDPNVKEMINAVEHPHNFTLDLPKFTASINSLYQKFDQYDRVNDALFRKFLLKSFDKNLLDKVNSVQYKGERALVTWIRLVSQHRILTTEQSADLKKKVLTSLFADYSGKKCQ
jgi:hypothetical protein